MCFFLFGSGTRLHDNINSLEKATNGRPHSNALLCSSVTGIADWPAAVATCHSLTMLAAVAFCHWVRHWHCHCQWLAAEASCHSAVASCHWVLAAVGSCHWLPAVPSVSNCHVVDDNDLDCLGSVRLCQEEELLEERHPCPSNAPSPALFSRVSTQLGWWPPTKSFNHCVYSLGLIAFSQILSYHFALPASRWPAPRN